MQIFELWNNNSIEDFNYKNGYNLPIEVLKLHNYVKLKNIIR